MVSHVLHPPRHLRLCSSQSGAITYREWLPPAQSVQLGTVFWFGAASVWESKKHGKVFSWKQFFAWESTTVSLCVENHGNLPDHFGIEEFEIRWAFLQPNRWSISETAGHCGKKTWKFVCVEISFRVHQFKILHRNRTETNRTLDIMAWTME